MLWTPGNTRRKPPRPELQRGDPINRGLQGCYPLYEGGGDTIHDLVRGDRGSINFGTASAWVPSFYGDGKIYRTTSQNGGHYISIPAINIPSDKPFSISYWALWGSASIAFTGQFGERDGVCSHNTNTTLVYLYANTNNDYFRWVHTGLLPVKVWHHILYRCNPDADNVEGWLNGVQLTADNNTFVQSAYTGITVDQLFDNGASGTNAHFGGLQNWRIWDRTITDSEIQRLYIEPWAGIVRPRLVPVSAGAAAGGVTHIRYGIDDITHGVGAHRVAQLGGVLAA